MAIIQEKNKNKWTKDGRSWYYDTYYYDSFGVKREKKSKLFKLKKEAEAAEREFLSNNDNNADNNKEISFEYAYNEWLELKKSTVKITSYCHIKTILNKWIYIKFKDFKDIKRITEDNIISWKKEFSKNLLKLEYKNKIIGYFREFLQFCSDEYDLSRKLYSKLNLYKISVSSKKNDAEWNFWTFEEYQSFIEVVDAFFDRVMFEFLYYTGVRLGEMIALKWKYVNLEKKYIEIKYTFTNSVEGKSYDFVDPKTKNSIRIIELDDDLAELLKLHLEEEKKIYGFNPEYLVFGNIKHISPTNFRRILNKYIEKANCKKITPHGFRHSHVSLLINLGCDSRDVAERIGDTIEVVEKTYYHMFPEKKKIPTNKLNELKLRGKNEVKHI